MGSLPKLKLPAHI